MQYVGEKISVMTDVTPRPRLKRREKAIKMKRKKTTLPTEDPDSDHADASFSR